MLAFVWKYPRPRRKALPTAVMVGFPRSKALQISVEPTTIDLREVKLIAIDSKSNLHVVITHNFQVFLATQILRKLSGAQVCLQFSLPRSLSTSKGGT